MQAQNLKLRLQIHFIVVGRIQSVFDPLTILRHQNYRCLDRGEHGQKEVQQNIGVRVKQSAMPHENESIEQYPREQDSSKDDDEGPRASESRNFIGEPPIKPSFATRYAHYGRTPLSRPRSTHR